MRGLIEAGPMSGGLSPVGAPAPAARDSRAPKPPVGRRTRLAALRIDLPGISPEEAEGPGDPRYLDARGDGRRFLLPSAGRNVAPFLNRRFPPHRDILVPFVALHAVAHLAPTARDAVAGEPADMARGPTAPAQPFDTGRIKGIAGRAEGTRR
ncbi:MAG: hypothetical protein N2422_11435 [Rhodobacteraceae bacterium]|nr:hypothetical protein [Paracoccaceae bacterium]